MQAAVQAYPEQGASPIGFIERDHVYDAWIAYEDRSNVIYAVNSLHNVTGVDRNAAIEYILRSTEHIHNLTGRWETDDTALRNAIGIAFEEGDLESVNRVLALMHPRLQEETRRMFRDELAELNNQNQPEQADTEEPEQTDAEEPEDEEPEQTDAEEPEQTDAEEPEQTDAEEPENEEPEQTDTEEPEQTDAEEPETPPGENVTRLSNGFRILGMLESNMPAVSDDYAVLLSPMEY